MKRKISLRGKSYRVAAIFKVGLLCAVCLLGNQAAGQRTDSLFIRNSEGKLLKTEVEGTGYTLIKVDCPAFTIQHVNGSVSPETIEIDYKSVKVATSSDTLCWLAQNLGASVQPSSSGDTGDDAAGWYWQFNRKQGYAYDSGTSSFTPSGISFVDYTESSDWTSENDPCTLLLGSAWRIPTTEEWAGLLSALGISSLANAFDSELKIHAAGLIGIGPAMLYRGSSSIYWYPTQSTIVLANFMRFSSSMIYDTQNKSRGYSIRCVRNLTE